MSMEAVKGAYGPLTRPVLSSSVLELGGGLQLILGHVHREYGMIRGRAVSGLHRPGGCGPRGGRRVGVGRARGGARGGRGCGSVRIGGRRRRGGPRLVDELELLEGDRDIAL